MDSFTTISNTSNIPTNSDDGGSGNNAYCVIAWPHLTHYRVRSAVISFYYNALTLFLDPHTSHSRSYDSPWSTARIWREFFHVASTLGARDIVMEGFFRSVLVLILWGFLRGGLGLDVVWPDCNVIYYWNISGFLSWTICRPFNNPNNCFWLLDHLHALFRFKYPPKLRRFAQRRLKLQFQSVRSSF